MLICTSKILNLFYVGDQVVQVRASLACKYTKKLLKLLDVLSWKIVSLIKLVEKQKCSGFFLSFFQLITKVQHKLHLQLQLEKHFNINYTLLNKLTQLLRIG